MIILYTCSVSSTLPLKQVHPTYGLRPESDPWSLSSAHRAPREARDFVEEQVGVGPTANFWGTVPRWELVLAVMRWMMTALTPASLWADTVPLPPLVPPLEVDPNLTGVLQSRSSLWRGLEFRSTCSIKQVNAHALKCLIFTSMSEAGYWAR